MVMMCILASIAHTSTVRIPLLVFLLLLHLMQTVQMFLFNLAHLLILNLFLLMIMIFFVWIAKIIIF